MDAITKSLLFELMDTPIRVSQICPGMVNTEFSTVRFRGDKEKADNVYKGVDPLVGQDIGKHDKYILAPLLTFVLAELVVFTASRPPHVNICDMLGKHNFYLHHIFSIPTFLYNSVSNCSSSCYHSLSSS